MKIITLLYLLFVLITLDFMTTFIGIEYMGATELNPLFYYFPNLFYWLSFKFIAGIICLCMIVSFYNDQHAKVIVVGLLLLNILYITVVTNNIIQIGVYL